MQTLLRSFFYFCFLMMSCLLTLNFSVANTDSSVFGLDQAVNSSLQTTGFTSDNQEDKAAPFHVQLEVSASQEILTHWQIKPGNYLYQKNFHFRSLDPKIKIDRIIFPEDYKEINDPTFGHVKVYQNAVNIPFQLILSQNIYSQKLEFTE